jgi:glycosyltransferase involved in cell wall biosynthesis
VVKFFNPEDMKDLADKMVLLIKNRELRENLAQNASKFITEYTWDKKEQEYLNLVDSLVNGKNC